jgi:DNA-binding transcriptional MerR regulator
MRIGELARRAGVPVPTIKYYTREGMLPPGERISANQVLYTESHVRRLTLIRAMLEVGGMSIASAREVLSQVDAPDTNEHTVLGLTQAAVGRSSSGEADTSLAQWLAEREVTALCQRHNWEIKPENPGWQMLVHLVATYRALGHGELLELLDRYAEAANELAAAELSVVGAMPTIDSKIEGVVLGTVLGDAALSALRRIAQEDASRRLEEQHTQPA